MSLDGQARTAETGYAMAALLMTMTIMAVLLSAAMPAWRTVAQREKEEELIFRGKQYARAVSLFQRKFGNAYPANFDALVSGRFLRKKYKDPITGEEFLPLTGAGQQNNPGRPQAAAPGAPGAQRGQQQPPRPSGATDGIGVPNAPASAPGTVAGAAAGFIGVVSKSNATSLRIYNGHTHYNEWAFVAQVVTTQPGAPTGGQPGTVPGGRPGERPGGRQPPQGPGGRALPPAAIGAPFPGAPSGPPGPGSSSRPVTIPSGPFEPRGRPQ